MDDTIGVCFVHGIYVSGIYLPGTLTFIYGFFQVSLFTTEAFVINVIFYLCVIFFFVVAYI